MNYQLLFLSLLTSITAVFAQDPNSNTSGFHKDSSMHHNTFHPKAEKGPNHGKIFANNGLKVEMVPPSNLKKHEVSYYVYDTLTNPVEAKNYKGSVKYVFGGANQYIEVPLIPTGKNNQYVAALEDWNEYKKAIVTLKANGQIYSVTFYNNVHPPATPQSKKVGGGNGHQGGGHHGGHGGGMGH
jgi:hypothetical protein